MVAIFAYVASKSAILRKYKSLCITYMGVNLARKYQPVDVHFVVFSERIGRTVK